MLTNQFLVLDAHAHLVPATLVDLIETNKHGIPGIVVREGADGLTQWYFGETDSGRPFQIRPFPPDLADLEKRYAWLGRNGIEGQLVSLWGEMHGYNLPEAQAAKWSRLANETIRDAVRGVEYLRPYATVPLADATRAAAELHWANENGFVGAMCGANVGPVVLAHERYDPFWRAAAETGMVVYIHPDYPHWNDRVGSSAVANGVGRMVDTATALSNLIAGGVFHRYPDLTVVGAHGGGGLPFFWPRLRHGLELAGSPYTADVLPPGLYFDTVVHDSRLLAQMIDNVGSERFILGSDFPLANRDDRPVDTVTAAITKDSVRRAVLSEHAWQLFGR